MQAYLVSKPPFPPLVWVTTYVHTLVHAEATYFEPWRQMRVRTDSGTGQNICRKVMGMLNGTFVNVLRIEHR